MAKKSNGIAIAIAASDEWTVSRDLDTLLEAEKIEKDPKRMAKVQALAKRRMMENAAIASGTDD